MACERVNISILVVDDDEASLAILANILTSLEYKVLTANSAPNALKTLREFEGFFDLIITELYIPGMCGFEFQKRVIDEFQLPVIMMSADKRKCVRSNSLKSGAALYILKPFCGDDFKDIWKYAVAERKGKLVIENELRSREGESPNEKIIIQDVNSSAAASSSTEPRGKRKHGKGKSKKEDQSEGKSQVAKKPKLVWTTYLQNLFLLAIRQIGLDRAVPKKILEIMNVPYLTRENVASHLQKYRNFLKKVAERGIMEGLSESTLRSRFASSIPATVIQHIQTRAEQLRVPLQQYLKRLSYQAGNRTIAPSLNSFNYGLMSLSDQQVSSNNYVTTQLGTGQFPYPLHNGLMLQNQHGSSLNQVRLGQSSFGSHNIGTNNNIGQSSYANPPYQANSSYDSGAIFPPHGGGHGLMTSANGLIRGYENYGSLGNHNSSYDQGNWNMGNLSSSNVLPQTSTYYNSGIQQNDGSQMVGTGIKGGLNNVGTAKNNSFDFNNVDTANNISFGFNNVGNANNGFGFINGTQNANMNVASLGNGDFGLVEGKFAFPSSASNIGDACASELPPPTLITDGTLEESVSGLPPLPQQLDDIVVENEHQNNNVTSISESEASQLDYDLSDIFFMLDEIDLLNETEENPNASEFLNSDFSIPCHVVQPLEKDNRDDYVIAPPATSTVNLPNESPGSSDKNSNKLLGDDGFAEQEEFFDRLFGDNVSSASNSATEQDWDMDVIEALFGTEAN